MNSVTSLLAQLFPSTVSTTSVSSFIKDKIRRFQARALRIIGLTAEEAAAKHKVLNINQLIDYICVNTLLKILSDPPITAKLPVNARGNSLTKKYQTSKAKPEKYSSSFVQK